MRAARARPRSSTSRPERLPPYTIPVTLSIGVAVFPDHARNSAELLARAEHALLQVKEEGLDSVALYEQRVARLPAGDGFATRFTAALDDDELELEDELELDDELDEELELDDELDEALEFEEAPGGCAARAKDASAVPWNQMFTSGEQPGTLSGVPARSAWKRASRNLVRHVALWNIARRCVPHCGNS